jgi:hypothetical protein
MPVGYHRYYSHFNTTMGEYKASDYDEELRGAGAWATSHMRRSSSFFLSRMLLIDKWLCIGAFGDAAAHSMGGAWKGKMF